MQPSQASPHNNAPCKPCVAGDVSATHDDCLPDAEVDARGLHCPLPILKAKKALNTMQSGQLLRVLTTDGGALRDFAAFARQTGNTLLKQGQSEDRSDFHLLRKR